MPVVLRALQNSSPLGLISVEDATEYLQTRVETHPNPKNIFKLIGPE